MKTFRKINAVLFAIFFMAYTATGVYCNGITGCSLEPEHAVGCIAETSCCKKQTQETEKSSCCCDDSERECGCEFRKDTSIPAEKSDYLSRSADSYKIIATVYPAPRSDISHSYISIAATGHVPPPLPLPIFIDTDGRRGPPSLG